MALSIRNAGSAAALALTLAASPALAADPAAANSTLGSVHEPIVSRTDYTLDLTGGPSGLAYGETQRLSGWFDGLGLGYGDTVSVDGPVASREAVGGVLSRYGMLVAREATPTGVGAPPAGSVRVVVSRAVARVEGCPDWSRGNFAEYGNALPSNFGCAAAQNLAAMIANPQDLVEGVEGGPASSALVSVKAIKSWRDAKNTGDAGLPGGITATSVIKNGGN